VNWLFLARTWIHVCRNRRAVGDVHVFQLVQRERSGAADSGRVSQGKAISGHGKFAADAAATSALPANMVTLRFTSPSA